MSPILHFLTAYFFACLLTKNVALRRAAGVGGILPDLDGFFILFDTQAYYIYHHAVLHSIIGGLVLTALFVPVIWLWGKVVESRKDSLKSIIPFFLTGFAIHGLGDVIGTNWKVQYFWPLNDWGISIYPVVANWVIYDVINPVFAVIFLLAMFAQPFIEKKSVFSLVSEKLDAKLIEYLKKSKLYGRFFLK